MTSQELKIRKFEGSDYPDIVRLSNTVFPERKRTEEFFRHYDKNKAEKCEHQRYIVEIEEKVIGCGHYTQLEWNYAPGKYFIYGCIDPDFQGQGYGSEFYRYLMDELEEKDPKKLVVHTREDKKKSIRFLEDRGFKETQRECELVLDVNDFDFDFEEFSGLEEKLDVDHGIKLRSLEEIRFDEENKRKLHELYNDVYKDVPISGEYTGKDFDRFVKSHESPKLFPEAYLVAVKDDKFIGLSSKWEMDGENTLFTQLTGVREKYRGKGIATAMKVKAIEIASEKGIQKMKTSTETGNEAMLHIAQKLGYEKKLAWISYEKRLKR